MIIGLGIDLCDLDRISAAIDRHGHKFADKILTSSELENMPTSNTAYIGSRFAAKEAAVKALGTGFSQKITFQDLEVTKNDTGQPFLNFQGRALQHYKRLGATSHHLSITHERNMAAAVVILEKD